MTARDKDERKKLLINPPFQLNFLSYTLGTSLTVVLIFFAANRYFFWKFVEKGRTMGLPENHVFFRFLDEQQFTFDMIFLVSSLAVIGLLVFYGLYLSNRIAGPIHHLKGYLEARLKNQAVGELRFRERDYFRELEEVVNKSFPAGAERSAELSHSDSTRKSS